MTSENLIEGADAYADLTEVAHDVQPDVPEATPTIVASAIASFNAGWLTAKQGC